MKHFGRILTAALALCMLLGLSLFVTACGGDDTIDYTITVSCTEARVLSNVKVVLKSEDGSAVTEAMKLTDGKAMFSLEADTYTAELEGVDAEYTYSPATVMAEKPYATITITKKSDSNQNPDGGTNVSLPAELNDSWANSDESIVLTFNGTTATLARGALRTTYTVTAYDAETGKISLTSTSAGALELTYDSAAKTITGIISNAQVVLVAPELGSRSKPYTFPDTSFLGGHNLAEGWYKYTSMENGKYTLSISTSDLKVTIEQGNFEIFQSGTDPVVELQRGLDYYIHIELGTSTSGVFTVSEFKVDLTQFVGTWTGSSVTGSGTYYEIVITVGGITVNGEVAEDIEVQHYDSGGVRGYIVTFYVDGDYYTLAFSEDIGFSCSFGTDFGDDGMLGKI